MVCTRSSKQMSYYNFSSEVSLENILGGTRHRSQLNYKQMNDTGISTSKQILFDSRYSHNTLEMRNKLHKR